MPNRSSHPTKKSLSQVAESTPCTPRRASGSPGVVLVHGGSVDGSGRRVVYDAPASRGIDVGVVRYPTLSLAGDVAATMLVYAGVVLTEAGSHDMAAAVVYITAFAPEKAE
jgi:hypothetical protein